MKRKAPPQAGFFIAPSLTSYSPTTTFLLPNNTPTTHNLPSHIERVEEEITSFQTLTPQTNLIYREPQ